MSESFFQKFEKDFHLKSLSVYPLLQNSVSKSYYKNKCQVKDKRSEMEIEWEQEFETWKYLFIDYSLWSRWRVHSHPIIVNFCYYYFIITIISDLVKIALSYVLLYTYNSYTTNLQFLSI